MDEYLPPTVLCGCRLHIHASNSVLVGLRPGIQSWLKFQPEDEGDAKSSYPGDSRGKMTCQCPSLRAETSTKIWMSGLNPNYNTTRPNSGLNLRNCCRNVRAGESLLSFATPSWLCRSHPREHPPTGEKLKLQQILFCLLIIQLSLYSVLISFAHNLHYRMLWVCSSGH